jgi:uncharacterized protein YcbK (DUF882 family)
MKYFKLKDFNCQETGENKMNIEFLDMLDSLRDVCGFPFVVTSGYRSPSHSIEKVKINPGTHAKGIATDIKITNGGDRYTVVQEAIKAGFTGIGIAKDFIHLDIRTSTPVIWTY